jgi:hypothetical protein
MKTTLVVLTALIVPFGLVALMVVITGHVLSKRREQHQHVPTRPRNG